MAMSARQIVYLELQCLEDEDCIQLSHVEPISMDHIDSSGYEHRHIDHWVDHVVEFSLSSSLKTAHAF